MKIRDIALIGILSATITAGKLALSFIPNIEIVTLLFMVYTVILGQKGLCLWHLFSTIEILMYGLSTWVLGVCYLACTDPLTAFIQKKAFQYKAALRRTLWLILHFFFAVVESLWYDV